MMGKTIFIIDDDEGVCRSVERCLYLEGYRTVAVTDPLSAMEKAHKETPDLILLDISMPGLNGIELCRLIRDDHTICDVPVIMLTAHYEETYIRSAIESGADDYIIKPFDPSDLKDKIRHVFLLFKEGLLPSQVKRRSPDLHKKIKDRPRAPSGERRRHKRHDTSFLVEYKGRSVWQLKKGKNISLGGLFICTDRIEEPGTVVFLEFSFPGTGAKFNVEGRVVWSRKEPATDDKGGIIYPSGMGIEFTMISPEEKAALEGIIEKDTDKGQPRRE